MFGEDEDDEFEINCLAENLTALQLDNTQLLQPNTQEYPIELLLEEQVLNLQHFKDEILNLQEKVGEKIRLGNDVQREPKHILEWMFKNDTAQWKQELKDRMDDGLRENKIMELLESWEYYAFLEFTFACHYYGQSPTVLTDVDQIPNFGKQRMLTLRRFEDLLQALGSGLRKSSIVGASNNDIWVPPSDRLQKYKRAVARLGEQLQPVSYLAHKTIYSLDDDKYRHLSCSWALLGVRQIYARGNNKCPTFIAAINKHLDIFAGGHLTGTAEEDTTLNVSKKVIAAAAGYDSFSVCNLHGIHLSGDRGIYSDDFQAEISMKGGILSGTVLMYSDYPFKIIRKGQTADRPIIGTNNAPLYTIHDDKKSKVACWAVPNDKTKPSYLAYRQDNGSIILLGTTEKTLGPGKWVLKKGSREPTYVYYNIPAENEAQDEEELRRQRQRMMDPISLKLAELNLLELTEFQGNSIWFMMRRFRITSIVADSILKVCYNFIGNSIL